MKHAVTLVGHLAWPVVVLVGFWLVRREVRLIVGRLAERIGSEETDVMVGREGIQIRQRVAPSDQARERLQDALRSDPAFEGKLSAWVEEKGLSISPTSLLYGSLYESVRRAAADELLPSNETSDERG